MDFETFMEILNDMVMSEMGELADNYIEEFDLRDMCARGCDPEEAFDLIYAKWVSEEE